MIEFKIERSAQSHLSSSVLITGVVLVNYLFPLVLITQQLSLLLIMFFALMIVMLVGLLLLAFNVQHLVENALVLLLFAWSERPQIPYLMRKNFVAHPHRNQKTTLKYAASLGFIIMIRY